MRISDYVANYILELLEENEDESVEIKRNDIWWKASAVEADIFALRV